MKHLESAADFAAVIQQEAGAWNLTVANAPRGWDVESLYGRVYVFVGESNDVHFTFDFYAVRVSGLIQAETVVEGHQALTKFVQSLRDRYDWNCCAPLVECPSR